MKVKKMRKFGRMEGEVGWLKVWLEKGVECERQKTRKEKFEGDLE